MTSQRFLDLCTGCLIPDVINDQPVPGHKKRGRVCPFTKQEQRIKIYMLMSAYLSDSDSDQLLLESRP